MPITVSSKTYTLTVSVEDNTIEVTAGCRRGSGSAPCNLPCREMPAAAAAAITPTAPLTAPVAATSTDAQTMMTTAISIEYDDLFRNNEQHTGKVVRFVGQVLEYGDQICLLCDNPGHFLRVGVTPLGYGVYDDPIYVLYEDDQRFLEDDIVTIWGTVDGLESYIAVLGNEITIPRIQALDVVLGEVSNPKLAGQPGQPAADRDADLRSGPGTNFAT